MNTTPYPVSDWQYEVANGDTQLGYPEWARHKQEADSDPTDKQYRVTWEIDIWAESPKAAALDAQEMQRDIGADVAVFSVALVDLQGIQSPVEIDLNDDETEVPA